MHGSFSRGDTMNFTAAIGPDFKAGYVDALPVSNADVGATAAKLMGLVQKPKGNLIGRVMTEAMPNGVTPQATSETVKSKPSANGLRTVPNFQRVLAQRYFDAAGFPGRTLGLDAEDRKQKTAGEKPPRALRRQWWPRPASSGSGCCGACRAFGSQSIPALRYRRRPHAWAPNSRSRCP